MKIVISGGSGFIGTALVNLLVKKGHEVVVVDRNPPRGQGSRANFIQADLMNGSIPSAFGECDAVINLSGANIFNRWTEEYKKLIVESRTKVTANILEVIQKSDRKPSVFISASAVGYYGDRKDELLFEGASAGDDFLASVCIEWERSASMAQEQGMRWVSVRTAIVLGPGGGMLAKLTPLYRWGIGGRLGSGKQWFSWIHINDLVEIYATAVTDQNIAGSINAASPGALTNRDFTKAMANAVHRPAFIPVPPWALRLGLGEFATAILSSQHVVPQKLINEKFYFQYPSIESALASIFSSDK